MITIALFFSIGEMLFIGRPLPSTFNKINSKDSYCHNKHTAFGIIVPSQKLITYSQYDEIESSKVWKLFTSKDYEVLTSAVPDILHWKPVEDFTCQDFLCNAVTITHQYREFVYNAYAFFIAKIDSPISQEDEVIGKYSKKTVWSEFSGSLIGFGITMKSVRLDELSPHSKDKQYTNALKVVVPHNGKMFKITKFSVLCCYGVPNFCHYAFPELTWEPISDGPFPVNAFPAGTTPNREEVYIGRKQFRRGNSDVGCVIPSNKCLSIALQTNVLQFHSDYEILMASNEEENVLEWGMYSGGEVPLNAVIGGYFLKESIFVGRTLVDSNNSFESTSSDEDNLSKESNAQLIGGIECKEKCLRVAWNGKSHTFQYYEVLMMKMRPKSLRQLCRNVIITATLGIPGRVNKLPLPEHLRDYCKVHHSD